jgi:hypothetical protein
MTGEPRIRYGESTQLRPFRIEGNLDITLDIQNDIALITMDDGKMNAIAQSALADPNVAF